MAQAFCPSDDCEVLCWSPWDTKEANLHDMHDAVVTDLPFEAGSD